jgi:DNA-binding NarL/FixJ family response regulator
MGMTPEQIAEAQRLVREGLTYDAIGKQLGLPQSMVGNTLSSVGTHRERLRERRNTIWKMNGEGATPTQIGAVVGLTADSVKAIIVQQKKYKSFY